MPAGQHVKEDDECKKVCQGLHDHIANRPLAYCSPSDLINADTCLVAMNVASGNAVANSLFMVQKPDARKVPTEDLKDPNIAILICSTSEMLDGGQCKWGTYEAELWGICRTVEKYGRYITTATAKFPISGPNFKAKTGFIVDSTTWIGRWKSLTLPIGQNDRLSAKARRLYTWSDGVADIAYWPLCIQHRSGEDISLAQVLTQLENPAKQRQAELKVIGTKLITIFIHSYHNVHGRHSEEFGYILHVRPAQHLWLHNTCECHRYFLEMCSRDKP